eukprot:84226-Prymnesium_polylepis.1
MTAHLPATLVWRTSRLLRARCTCFDRVVVHEPAFNPNARRSRRRIVAFREAVLAHLPRAAASGE